MTKKVFIVEDEPDLRDTLQYNFENEGFKVKSFSNGESFLETIKKYVESMDKDDKRFDVIG